MPKKTKPATADLKPGDLITFQGVKGVFVFNPPLPPPSHPIPVVEPRPSPKFGVKLPPLVPVPWPGRALIAAVRMLAFRVFADQVSFVVLHHPTPNQLGSHTKSAIGEPLHAHSGSLTSVPTIITNIS